MAGGTDQERLDRRVATGDEFGAFLAEQDRAVATTLHDLGL